MHANLSAEISKIPEEIRGTDILRRTNFGI